MKKGIILVLIVLLLAGCNGGTKKPENGGDNGGGNDTPTEKTEVKFPFAQTYGYWVKTDGEGFLNLYQNETGADTFDFGDFGNYYSGRIQIESYEETAENLFRFKIKYLDNSNLLGEKSIDISELEDNMLIIDDEYYTFISLDYSEADDAARWFRANSLVNKLNGYWNENKNNLFVYVGKNDEAGDFVLVPGLYESEPGGTYVIDGVDHAGSHYAADCHLMYDPSSTRTFSFDLTDLANGKIEFEGKSMYYGGIDFDTAYAAYSKNK